MERLASGFRPLEPEQLCRFALAGRNSKCKRGRSLRISCVDIGPVRDELFRGEPIAELGRSVKRSIAGGVTSVDIGTMLHQEAIDVAVRNLLGHHFVEHGVGVESGPSPEKYFGELGSAFRQSELERSRIATVAGVDGGAMLDQHFDHYDLPLQCGHVQGRVTVRVASVEVGAGSDVALQLVDVAIVYGAVEAEGRRVRIAASGRYEGGH